MIKKQWFDIKKNNKKLFICRIIAELIGCLFTDRKNVEKSKFLN